jgi:hypothetical protein
MSVRMASPSGGKATSNARKASPYARKATRVCAQGDKKIPWTL